MIVWALFVLLIPFERARFGVGVAYAEDEAPQEASETSTLAIEKRTSNTVVAARSNALARWKPSLVIGHVLKTCVDVISDGIEWALRTKAKKIPDAFVDPAIKGVFQWRWKSRGFSSLPPASVTADDGLFGVSGESYIRRPINTHVSLYSSGEIPPFVEVRLKGDIEKKGKPSSVAF